MSLIDLNIWDSLKKIYLSYFMLTPPIDHKEALIWVELLTCSFEVKVKHLLPNYLPYWKHLILLICLLLSECQSNRTSQRVTFLQHRQRSPHHCLSPRQSRPVFYPYQEDKEMAHLLHTNNLVACLSRG